MEAQSQASTSIENAELLSTSLQKQMSCMIVSASTILLSSTKLCQKDTLSYILSA